MSELEQHIRQLEAKAAHLEQMIKAKRAKPAELVVVNDELKKARGAVSREKAASYLPKKEHVAPISQGQLPVILPTLAGIDEDLVTSVFYRKGQLMEEIKANQKEQQVLSNQLHLIPENVPCPELTERTVELAKLNEDLWSECRFIENNGKLLDEKDFEKKRDPQAEFRLLAIASELKSLRDTRLKLETKIEKPHLHSKKPAVKLQEWQIELIEVKSLINALIFEKEQIKG